jgi:hypothetical protein
VYYYAFEKISYCNVFKINIFFRKAQVPGSKVQSGKVQRFKGSGFRGLED